MALSDYKINEFKKSVGKLDDRPQMSAGELKEWFDSNAEDEIRTSVNGIIDEALILLDKKVDVCEGKRLSSNDYTNEEKMKLAGIEMSMQHTHNNKNVLDSVTNNKLLYDGSVSISKLAPDVTQKFSDIENNMGDIESALDGIIAIQNELIGGESV